MDTDEHVRREIDRSFGDGPERPPDHHDLVTRGHRALARRRLATGAVALAVVAAVGGTTLAATGLDDASGPRRPGYAATPSGSPSGSPSAGASPSTAVAPAPTGPRPSKAEYRRALNTIASYDESGRLVLAPQATVLDRIAHPYRTRGPGRSVALSLDFHGSTYWAALYRSPSGSFTTSVAWSGSTESTFETWVRERGPDMVLPDEPTSPATPDTWPGAPSPDLVRFVGGTERLRPLDGVRILRQQAHVSVGASFAGPADRTAAALVEAADGTRSYVLARLTDGGPAQYIGVPAADGGPTLAAFLDLARTKYAEGGGGLL